MKPLLLFAFALLFLPVRADDASPAPATDYEKLKARKDVLISESWSELGTVNGGNAGVISIRVYTAKPENGKTAKAMELSAKFIDEDELPNLLAAIGAILKLDKAPGPLERVETSFTSHSGLRVAGYTDPNGKLEFYCDDGSISPDGLRKLAELIKIGQDKLKSIP